ncbi:adenosylcobinamide-GDP ribazoletransferase [Aggregatilineales bacterium SYSU G02658]
MRDLLAALSFLTVLPTTSRKHAAAGRSFGWFPLVGLLVGTVLMSIQVLVPPALAPLLILAAWVILTGGLHLDGFADTCDGLLATTTPERRREIMKDPRTGTWAVVGVALLLIAKLYLIPQTAPIMLLLAPVAGRWAMVVAAVAFPYVGGDGLGAYFRQGLTRWQLAHASLFALGVVAVAAEATQYHSLLMVGVPLLALMFGGWAAQRLGGGLTGDVYGATCELTEVLFLLGAAWLAA